MIQKYLPCTPLGKLGQILLPLQSMEKLLLTSITDQALNTQFPVVSKQMAYCISEKLNN